VSNRPLQSFRSGVAPGVTVNVWPGKESGQYTFSIAKRYKTTAGEWKDTGTLFHGDVAAVSLLAARAIAWADADRARNYKGQGGGGAPPQQTEAFSTESSGGGTPAIASPEITIDDDDIPF
jgi:hypothetical protein